MSQFYRNDLEQAEQIARGDSQATEAFISQHYSSVFRFLKNLTRQREDAEDLTQLAFIKTKQNIKSYKGKGSLKTWLYRIAIHEYTHWKRKQKPSELLRHDLVDPNDRFLQSLEADALLLGLEQIPNRLRVAFLLYEVQELSVPEIASILGVPEGTVKSRLFHARKQLGHLLEGRADSRENEGPNREGQDTNEKKREPLYESSN